MQKMQHFVISFVISSTVAALSPIFGHNVKLLLLSFFFVNIFLSRVLSDGLF